MKPLIELLQTIITVAFAFTPACLAVGGGLYLVWLVIDRTGNGGYLMALLLVIVLAYAVYPHGMNLRIGDKALDKDQ